MSLKGDNMLWQRKYEQIAHELDILRASITEKDKEMLKHKKKTLDLEDTIVTKKIQNL